MPGKVSRLSSNKREASEQLLEQYEKLLTHLKSHGALLNSVKPEMMLDTDDFSRIMHTRTSKLLSGEGDPSEADRLAHWVRPAVVDTPPRHVIQRTLNPRLLSWTAFYDAVINICNPITR